MTALSEQAAWSSAMSAEFNQALVFSAPYAAQQPAAPDCLRLPLLRRSRFRSW